MKYFVCYRERNWLNEDYVKEFLKTHLCILFHKTWEEAKDELRHNFYDDSDYSVCSVCKNGNVKILRLNPVRPLTKEQVRDKLYHIDMRNMDIKHLIDDLEAAGQKEMVKYLCNNGFGKQDNAWKAMDKYEEGTHHGKG